MVRLLRPVGLAHRVDALDRFGRGRHAESLAVEDLLVRTCDERGDDRRPLLQGRYDQRIHLLRIPRRKRDHDALREVLLEELQRLRIGMCRAVLSRLEPGMGADEKEGMERLAAVVVLHLLADAVEARGDVLKRGDESSVRGSRSDVAAVGRDARHDAAHRVLADPADREEPRSGIRHGVEESLGESVRGLVYRCRAEKVGRGG